jgi:cephalosporin hydroxylase
MFNYTEIMDEILDDFSIWGFKSHQYPLVIGVWPEEIKWFVELCLCAPTGDFLEVGSHHGGSAVLMAISRQYQDRGPTIFCNDIKFTKTFDRNLFGVGKMAHLINKIEDNSLNLKIHLDELKPSISLAFLDGWHSFRAVVSEFNSIKDYLVDGALLLFHDTEANFHSQVDEYTRRAYSYMDRFLATDMPAVDPNDLKSYHEAERLQDFEIGAAVAWIKEEYELELIEIPDRFKCDYTKITGPPKRGTTGGHNAISALRWKTQ